MSDGPPLLELVDVEPPLDRPLDVLDAIAQSPDPVQAAHYLRSFFVRFSGSARSPLQPYTSSWHSRYWSGSW